MVRAHGRSPSSSFLTWSLLCDILGLPLGACLDFLRAREWLAAASRYSTLFPPFSIRLNDIVPGGAIMNLHIQSYLASLDAEWKET